MRGATYAATEIGVFLILATLIGVVLGALFVSIRRDQSWRVADGEQKRADGAEAQVRDLERRLDVAGKAIRELEGEQQESLVAREEAKRLHEKVERLEASANETNRLREIIDERDLRILELERELGEREIETDERVAPIPEHLDATTVRTGVGNVADSAVFFDICDRDTEPA